MCESLAQFRATHPRQYIDCDPPGDGDDGPKEGGDKHELKTIEIRDVAGEVVDPVRILSGLNLRG